MIPIGKCSQGLSLLRQWQKLEPSVGGRDNVMVWNSLSHENKLTNFFET